MGLKLSNNAVSKLAAGISTTDATLTVLPGEGAKFPAITGDDWFPLTLVKSTGEYEIVKATARSSDVITVTRAQETTTALSFAAGDRVELRFTAGAYDALDQQKLDAAGGSIAGSLTVGLDLEVGNDLDVTGDITGATVTVPSGGSIKRGTHTVVDTGNVPSYMLVMTGARIGYVGTTAPDGWVLANGRTIGSASSGATERANADTEALFTLLWASYANTELPIQDSTGAASSRGASASADFAANKRLPLPDYRGRVAAGKDAMGGATAGRLTSSGSGIAGTTMGAAGGAETHTLTTAQMPQHTHGVTDPGHTHGTSPSGSLLGNNGSGVGLNSAGGTPVNYSTSILSGSTGISIQNAGSSQAHNNTQPTIVETMIIKL